MVARCTAAIGPESVLATLTRDAAQLRNWRPGVQTLADTVMRLPADVVGAAPHDTLEASLRLRDEVITAVPEDLKPPPDESGLEAAYRTRVFRSWSLFDAPLDRYLAAKAFASWTAYQGRDVAAIVRGLESALALVRVEAARQCRDARRDLDAELLREAIRSADFALNHLAVGEDLADAWSRSVQDL
jgi:hypothetical protein